MSYIKAEVFNLDGQTQLEFVNRKTVVVIGKDQFAVCKQLTLEDAPDEEFAKFLNIPLDKVRYFKYKMQQYEDSIRARRRAAKLEKQRKKNAKTQPLRKREMSSEERFRRARELISKGLGTNQISKILKVSERSVTRFKRRMREEKQRLKAEGKIIVDPNDPDDENSFKHLAPEEKYKKAEELFRKRLKIHEISEILKISERSVRRWKDKLDKGRDCKVISTRTEEAEKPNLKVEAGREKRPVRLRQLKNEDEYDDDVSGIEEESSAQPAKKKRRLYVDREKVEYAKELMENKLSNKEMSMLLEISIACVRKLKTKINDGTVEELIDDSEEHYNKLSKGDVDAEQIRIEPDNDPLNVLDAYYSQQPVASTSYTVERKPKTILRERDIFIARLLRENSIRTMDIAKMMKISERSVTRLLAKSKDTAVMTYDLDIVNEVNQMLDDKERLLSGETVSDELDCSPVAREQNSEAKRQVGNSLLSMNVTTKDIAKMLDVSEKTVQRWKTRLQIEPTGVEIEEELETEEVLYEEEPDEEIAYDEYEDDQFE